MEKPQIDWWGCMVKFRNWGQITDYLCQLMKQDRKQEIYYTSIMQDLSFFIREFSSNYHGCPHTMSATVSEYLWMNRVLYVLLYTQKVN